MSRIGPSQGLHPWLAEQIDPAQIQDQYTSVKQRLGNTLHNIPQGPMTDESPDIMDEGDQTASRGGRYSYRPQPQHSFRVAQPRQQGPMAQSFQGYRQQEPGGKYAQQPQQQQGQGQDEGGMRTERFPLEGGGHWDMQIGGGSGGGGDADEKLQNILGMFDGITDKHAKGLRVLAQSGATPMQIYQLADAISQRQSKQTADTQKEQSAESRDTQRVGFEERRAKVEEKNLADREAKDQYEQEHQLGSYAPHHPTKAELDAEEANKAGFK